MPLSLSIGATPTPPTTQVGTAGRMLIVVGAEGEAEYGRQFATWAERWAAAAGTMPVRWIGPRESSAAPTQPATMPTLSPVSDKDALRAALTIEADADGPLWLVLIGHGTPDGPGAQFNLRGPDVSDRELAEWLRPVRGAVAVIDCSSASGPFLNRLSAANRVIVTATRSGSEYQFVRFGEFLSSAISDPAADLDKDGRTSLLEAFLSASRQTDAFYKQAGRIATEHALLDDNGDGLGVSADWFAGTRPTRAAKTGAAVDGPQAGQWFLLAAAADVAVSPAVRERRAALEAEVETLRAKKATMAEDDYYAALEVVLVKLAETYR